MGRVRPGRAIRGTGPGTHARRSAGADSVLTSVDAGEDFDGRTDDTPGAGERPSGAAEAAGGGRPASRLWHVTLSVSGGEAPLADVRRALEQLAHDHPFLLTSRYAVDHAEIRYWEEARDLHDAAAVALRLWGEHRSSAKLPPWEIVGLEVIDRETYHQRVAEGYGPPPAARVGVHPF
ncbi:hypothetical protein [Streptomyces tremellae]|uniref:Condensation domain-containing protein n=1 Tax=Streptomyces tremellae TaxID=1124239 RepID=A0ABP7G194_9ACTN